MGGGFQSGGGIFGNILGPNFLGLTGKTSESEQETELDPTTEALNRFRLNMVNNAGFNSRELFGRPDYAYNLSPEAQGISSLMQSFGSNPLQWYNQSWSMLNPTLEQERLQNLSGENRNYLENTLQNYLGTGQGNLQNTLSNYLSYGQNQAGSVLNQQLGYINNNLRPEMTSAGNQYFKEILGPQLGNEYALMGLARSGGRQEAEAKGAASIALPIEQTLAGLSGNALSQYGGNLANLTNAAYGQYGSGLQNLINSAYSQFNQGLSQNNLANYSAQAQLGSNALQNLFSLNQAYPGVATSMLGTAFQAADYPRQLQQQGFQGQQNAFLSAFNNTPYTPATTIRGTNIGNEGLLNTAFMGGVGSGIGRAASMGG